MSRTVPTGGPPEWPYEPERGQGRGGEQNVPAAGRGDSRGGQARGPAGYDDQERGGQDGRGYYPPAPGYGNQGYPGQRPDPRGQGGPGAQGPPGYNGPRGGAAYPEQGGYDRPSYPPAPPGARPGQNPGPAGAPNGRGYGGPGYSAQGYNPPGYGNPGAYADQPTQAYYGYGDQTVRTPGYPDDADPRYRERGGPGGQGGPGGSGPGGPGPGRPGPGQPKPKKVRFRRTRRLARLRSVRIVAALVAVFLVLVMVSAGQATFKNNGQSASSNLAEWARDHYLGPVVTFGEWLSYNPPKAGGKPSFSLAIPKGEEASPAKKAAKGFTPDIPATLKSLAGSPLPGEGQWRVVEKVKGEPAIFTTFLRDATYTSYVNGVASMDQRLVSFQLHPGSEDPGPGDWGSWGATSIAPGARTGLVATFNGGFKLDSAGGGFYLNGHYDGSLVDGAASIVYYKNGTVNIGEWGRDFSMNSSIEGVRQNLKLLVDHGQVAADANSDVMSNWGATLGGGYYVWRSGLGITKDGRIIYVYGPALNAQDLGQLLQRAGAVEGMQLDINPYWMKYEYYTVNGNPADPTPVNLLPTQQQTAYSYYSTYTRDFTAVYAR